MKVQVNITLTDPSNEEQLVEAGLSSKKLLESYTEAFANILQGIAHWGVKVDLHVVVTDNTKEETLKTNENH